jgi:hypothetical protein
MLFSGRKDIRMDKEKRTVPELLEMIRERVPEMKFHHMQLKRDPAGWDDAGREAHPEHMTALRA